MREMLYIRPDAVWRGPFCAFGAASLLYALGWMAAQRHWRVLGSLCLLSAAVGLFIYCARRARGWMNPPGLLALGFWGGEALACLQLSRLQRDWSTVSWLSFYLFYACFYLVYYAAAAALYSARRRRCCTKLHGSKDSGGRQTGRGDGSGGAGRAGFASGDFHVESGFYADGLYANDVYVPGLYANDVYAAGLNGAEKQAGAGQFYRLAIMALTLTAWLAFALEAAVLGYVPLLIRDTPHAYSYFHISGVHYFTTLFVLVPALSVQYICSLGWESREAQRARLPVLLRRREVRPVLLSCFAALLLPLLLVSRFQLIFSVALAMMVYLLRGGRLRARQLLALALGMLGLYVLLTVARAHSVSYLNGIFEMKYPATPIFITQPYIYIANNYDNFNMLTLKLPQHSHGLKMLFPFFALSGLKFLQPSLTAFPLYTTKAELTTLTLIYDAYYDFGLAGVGMFGAVLALFAALLENLRATTLPRSWKEPVEAAVLRSRKTSGKAPGEAAVPRSREESGEKVVPRSGEKSGEKVVPQIKAGTCASAVIRPAESPGLQLMRVQLYFYLLFSFFTTWFSNPASWFYFAVSLLLHWIYVYWRKKCVDGLP